MPITSNVTKITKDQENEAFRVIGLAKENIMKTLQNSQEGTYLLCEQITENNITKLEKIGKKTLTGPSLKTFIFSIETLKKFIKIITTQHYQWAIVQGKRYGRKYEVNEVDAESCAAWGLIRAAYRFQLKVNMSLTFQTYADQWIRQIIERNNSKEKTILDSTLGDDGDSKDDRLMIDSIGYTEQHPDSIFFDQRIEETLIKITDKHISKEGIKEVRDWYYGDGEVTSNVRLAANLTYQTLI